jgi:hypothetical protein
VKESFSGWTAFTPMKVDPPECIEAKGLKEKMEELNAPEKISQQDEQALPTEESKVEPESEDDTVDG